MNAEETESEIQWSNQDIGKRINLIILTKLINTRHSMCKFIEDASVSHQMCNVS